MQPAIDTKTQMLPDIDWVEIPAGEFIYGETKDRQTLALEGFNIARYPVTNIQYQAFVDAGEYIEERWWVNLSKPEPEASHGPQANRPRTNVDWYEAMAFCRWLSAQLGYEVNLPTEQQWEKAARGEGGLEYPWGKEYRAGFANVDEKSEGGGYLEQTTAVGLYPHGTSTYGVEDMLGNVWEWCLNKYDKTEEIAIDSNGDTRVLRGGSWIDYPNHARAALRLRDDPDYRFNYIGFRLSCSLPFSDR